MATSSTNSATARGQFTSSAMPIQKNPLGQVMSPAPAALSKVSGKSLPVPQPAVVAGPAVFLNLSSFAKSNLLTTHASSRSAAAVLSSAPVNLAMSMRSSQTRGYDQQGELVQSFSRPTNQVKITVNLVKGVSYTLAAGYGYSRTQGAAAPTFTLSAKSATNVTDGNFTSQSSLSGTFKATSTGAYTLTLASSAGSTLSNISLRLYGKAQLPTNSGDANVNALLQGQNAWWHSPGTAPVQGGTVINGALKTLVSGSSSTRLTYGFLSAAPTSGSANDKSGFQATTNTQKIAIRAALDYISSITKLTFEQVDSSTGGANDVANINFGTNLQTTSDGYAYGPNSSPAIGKTYVYINNKTPSNMGNFSSGTNGWTTLLHEIGHALGLKHPGNYNAGLPGNQSGTPPYLPASTDNHQYSIMSYRDNSYTTSVANSSYMLYDIAALQYLYGVNANSTTATAGSFNFTNSTPSTTYLKTLWSNTGNDQINLTGMSNSSVVNLNPGSFSSINIRSNTSNQNNVSIAYGSKINSVKLSTNATTNDKVVLNNAYATGGYNTVLNLTNSDKLSIKSSIFGNLSASNVAIGANLTAASNATSKLIVNSTTGDIYYDADANATRSRPVKIANYTKATNFNFAVSNFEFIA